MDFNTSKRNYINSKYDRSTKGSIDKPIRALIDAINKHESYYTTSSCSGRIMLFLDKGNKKDSRWIFQTHKKTTIDMLPKISDDIDGLLSFRMQGAILHVTCKDIVSAQKLIDIAKQSGFKRSGIIATTKRVIVELISTEIIDVPLADNKMYFIDEDYLKFLIKKANEKLEITWKKIERFKRLFDT